MREYSQSPPKGRLTGQTSKRFPPRAIRKELERVLSSPVFTNASQLSRFLRFVVEESLCRRQNNINQYSIGVKALGRSIDFDPSTNPIVRIQARRLRNALNQYYQQEGRNDTIRIVIPVGGYAPAFYHNESLSIRNEPDIRASSSLTADDQVFRSQECPSILLLPLTTLKDDQRLVSFAERFMLKLMVAINRFWHFRIIGPLSCEELKEQYDNPSEIGREYDADFMLYGYLFKQENMIKLILKVIATSTGNTLWADTFDDIKNTDEFQIFEDEISSHVSSILADKHGIISRALSQKALSRPSESLNLCDAIFLHYYYRDVLSKEAYQAAKEALENALRICPNNPYALTMLADLYTIRYDCLEADDDILKRAKELFERAISIDPKYQHAQFLKARFYLYNRDRRGRKLFMNEIERVLLINPNNASILVISGLLIILAGEQDHGMTLVKKGLRLNPYIPSIYHHTAIFMYYYLQGLYEESLQEALRINKAKIVWDPLTRAAALGQLGLRKEAGAALRELLALRPDFATQSHELMHRILFSDKNVEMLLQGLYKAGLPH